MRPLGHFRADAAVADQSERAAEQTARLRILLLVPPSGAKLRDVVGHAPVEREHQRERQLGDRNRVPARTVRHVDAAARRRGDVDRVVTRSRAHDEREPPRFERRRADRRAADDQHLGAAVANRIRERLVLQVRLIQHLTAGRLQAVHPALLKLVGDQYLHEPGPSIAPDTESTEATDKHGDTEQRRSHGEDRACDRPAKRAADEDRARENTSHRVSRSCIFAGSILVHAPATPRWPRAAVFSPCVPRCSAAPCLSVASADSVVSSISNDVNQQAIAQLGLEPRALRRHDRARV